MVRLQDQNRATIEEKRSQYVKDIENIQRQLKDAHQQLQVQVWNQRSRGLMLRLLTRNGV